MRRLRGTATFAAGLSCGLLIHWWSGTSSTATAREAIAGGPPNCPADIAPSPDGNGVVDVDDLLTVINAWGACPTDDADGDGWTIQEGDCNDANPDIHPGAPELCNGIDDDCDTQI